MRAVVQRVSSSRVTVDERVTGEVKKGLLVLLGVTHDDTSKDVDYMVDKVTNLRIFENEFIFKRYRRGSNGSISIYALWRR